MSEFPDVFQMSCPLPLDDHETVQMAHGGGGRLMRALVEGLFLPAFAETVCRDPMHRVWEARREGGPDSSAIGVPQALEVSPKPLAAAAAQIGKLSEPPAPHDSAVVDVGGVRLALTTDSFVVSPLFFPGGDIGKLAVFGTVNDLAMAGAKPAALSAGFILEEGLKIETLRRVVASMRDAALEVGMPIVTGDTKVVDRGKGDGVFINTSGIGRVPEGVDVRPGRVRPGDAILVSGDLGRHGIAILSVREGLRFEGALPSDCASLAGLVEAMLACGGDIHCLRDLTRGGLAAALSEIAGHTRLGMEIDEAAIPVAEPVAAACELLGLDPLYVANEGRLVAFVPAEAADRVLQAMQSHPAAAGAAVIGSVVADHPGVVVCTSLLGGGRIVDQLSGEQMPRIC